MKPLRLLLLALVPFMLTAQNPDRLAGDPPEVGPANLMEVLWSLPVEHKAADALLISLIEWNFGCDKYPQTLVGLWDRFVCHANHWARLRKESGEQEYSWPAAREWKQVQESFKDLNVLVKNE